MNKESTTLALTDYHNMKHTKMIPRNLCGKVEMRMEICSDLVERLLLESSLMENQHVVIRPGSPI
jgi:hypothetical protein